MRRFDNFRRSRNEQDKLLAKICIYAFILLAALILFEKVIGNLPNIGSSIAKATNYLNTLTAPFLMGFAIAYVMNPFLNFFEKIFKIVDCSDATTDACCVFTAACYATTLMADGVLAGASGVGKRTMGAPGEQKKSRQDLR